MRDKRTNHARGKAKATSRDHILRGDRRTTPSAETTFSHGSKTMYAWRILIMHRIPPALRTAFRTTFFNLWWDNWIRKIMKQNSEGETRGRRTMNKVMCFFEVHAVTEAIANRYIWHICLEYLHADSLSSHTKTQNRRNSISFVMMKRKSNRCIRKSGLAQWHIACEERCCWNDSHCHSYLGNWKRKWTSLIAKTMVL